MHKKKTIVFWIIGIVLLVMLGAIGLIYIYSNYLFNKVEKVKIDKNDIGITEEVKEKLSQYDDRIINIALLGIDSGEDGVGRSDSIMIATIDTVNSKLKLTSIMRDSYVTIEEYGEDKINHAYAFGGAQLAIKTLNENFNLNIEDFVAVNFTSLPNIVDKIGGIELYIDSEELKYINLYIKGINKVNRTSEPSITSIGLQHMSGTQALAYCRIRYTDGGDYKRTERHREVLTKIFNKILSMYPTRYPSLISEILPMVNTSLDYSKILSLGAEIIKFSNKSIQLDRYPLDEDCEGKMINGVYYLTFDKKITIEKLYKYIFEDK